MTLNPSTATLTAGGDPVALTAAVEPGNATDRTVKWSVGGTDSGAVSLYSDETCETPASLDTATDRLTVYAKGMSAGEAIVTVTSNADETKGANYAVAVTKADAKNGQSAGTQRLAKRGEAVQVVLVRKGDPAPAKSLKGAKQTCAKAFVRK